MSQYSPSGSGWGILAELPEEERNQIRDEILGIRKEVCVYKKIKSGKSFYFKTPHGTSYFIYKFCPECGKQIEMQD